MLVHRVDSSDVNVWSFDVNTVNCNPDHMYYELLRADYQGEDSRYDPFPRAGHVTTLNNSTSPNLMTWSGQRNDMGLADIVEQDGIITFNVVNSNGSEPLIMGDVDGDGMVGIADVVELIDYILAGSVSVTEHPAANLDVDGVISIADLTELVDIILSKS